MQAWHPQSTDFEHTTPPANQIAYAESRGLGIRLWTPKYYAFQVYSREKVEEKLRYMHMNPVRAGLVAKATDWKWSSARWYERRQSVGVPISWVD
ncbi:MAG: hypothetical protein KDA81_14440 [Planctomycetaceae bacterium]|nr:hypothetical protein [Planctomycetaceae bacterium]